MLFVLLSKRFLHMTVLAGFAFVAIRANLLGSSKIPKHLSIVKADTFLIQRFFPFL